LKCFTRRRTKSARSRAKSLQTVSQNNRKSRYVDLEIDLSNFSRRRAKEIFCGEKAEFRLQLCSFGSVVHCMQMLEIETEERKIELMGKCGLTTGNCIAHNKSSFMNKAKLFSCMTSC
jgi:hypothetical protein